MYINQSELVSEIKIFQSENIMSVKLVEMIYLLADKIHCFKKYNIDKDDFRQDCIVHFMAIHMKIDLESNAFSYLTTMFCRKAMSQLREKVKGYQLIANLTTGIHTKLDDLTPEPMPRRVIPKKIHVPKVYTSPEPPEPRVLITLPYLGHNYTYAHLAEILNIKEHTLRRGIGIYGTVEAYLQSREPKLKVQKPPKPLKEPKPKALKPPKEPKPNLPKEPKPPKALKEPKPKALKPPKEPGFQKRVHDAPKEIRYVSYQGKDYTVTDLAELLGRKRKAVDAGLRRYNYDVEAYLTGKPCSLPKIHLLYQGRQYTIRELAILLGKNEDTIRSGMRTYGNDVQAYVLATCKPRKLDVQSFYTYAEYLASRKTA